MRLRETLPTRRILRILRREWPTAHNLKFSHQSPSLISSSSFSRYGTNSNRANLANILTISQFY